MTRSWKKIASILVLCVFVSAVLIQIGSAQAVTSVVQEKKNPFFTEKINALIEEDQRTLAEQGCGNLVIPKKLHHFTTKMVPKEAMYVAKKLRKAGFEAYFIGGCVRDMILGYPSMDYDITSNVSYAEAAKIFGDNFHLHYSGKNAYGGVTVKGNSIDLATYSALPEYMVGAKGMPNPSERNLITDAYQRDLPINAIYYNPFKGELLDFAGGIKCLRDGIIDTMSDPELELAGDPRVIIRLVRFAARFDFRISDRVDASMQTAQRFADIYPRNAVYYNFTRCFDDGYARKAFVLLDKYGLVEAFLKPYSLSEDKIGYKKYLEQLMDDFDRTDFDSLKVDKHVYIFAKLCARRVEELKPKLGVEAAVDQVIDEINLVADLKENAELGIRTMLLKLTGEDALPKAA